MPLPDTNRASRGSILLIGEDPGLLESRGLVLNSAGYHTLSCSSADQVTDAQLLRCDLLLLCHSVPKASAVRLIEALHSTAAGAPVLQLVTLDGMAASETEPQFVALAGPAALLREVARLIASSANRLSQTYPGSYKEFAQAKLSLSDSHSAVMATPLLRKPNRKRNLSLFP